MTDPVFIQISIVVIVSALLSCVALIARQPIIIAYIAGGLLVGGFGLGWVKDTTFIDEISRIGVTLLLFLAGIVLHPRRLRELFRQTILLTLVNSIISFFVCAAFCLLWSFDLTSAIFIGLTLIFSSTILVLKLIPTTALHHKRMGAYSIAILIAQDLIAIGMLVFLEAGQGSTLLEWALLPIKGILLIAATIAAEQIILRRIMAWSSRFQETLQLLAISWCLGIALAAEHLGLSYEIGAFIAGVALARSPLSFFLSEQLKPFRDFFLVFFFFVLGTRFDPATCSSVMVPALLLTLMMMSAKYLSFRTLFRRVGEEKKFAHETGMRLAQASEFSLILVLAEQRVGLLDGRAFQLVQLVTVFSMIASSCIVVARFPSPLATNPKLKQD